MPGGALGAWAGVFKGRVWLMVPRPAVRGCSGEGMEVGTPPITGRCTAEELAGSEGGARHGATCRPPTSAPALLVCSPCPRYAADQLTWLIIQSTSGMGGLDAMDLQDKLNACGKLQHRPSCTGAAHSLPPAFGQREERSGVSLGPPGCALRLFQAPEDHPCCCGSVLAAWVLVWPPASPPIAHIRPCAVQTAPAAPMRRCRGMRTARALPPLWALAASVARRRSWWPTLWPRDEAGACPCLPALLRHRLTTNLQSRPVPRCV